MAVLPSGEYSVTLNAIFIKKKVAFALFCKSKCHFFISRFQSGNKLFTSALFNPYYMIQPMHAHGLYQ